MTNIADPAVQTITLDDERTVAVFVDTDETTRVFYDLDALFAQYAMPIMQQSLIARLSDDENMKAEVRGATMLLESIRQSIEAVRLDADFQRS